MRRFQRILTRAASSFLLCSLDTISILTSYSGLSKFLKFAPMWQGPMDATGSQVCEAGIKEETVSLTTVHL